MVLCDSLIYNVPGTFTIEVVADETSYWNGNDGSDGYDLKSKTFVWSQTGMQAAVEHAGVSMASPILGGLYAMYLLQQLGDNIAMYKSVLPHWIGIAKAMSGKVAATRDGEDCDVVTALGEYLDMGDLTGYFTHTYVLTFDRIGLRKDDILNIENYLDILYPNVVFTEENTAAATFESIACLLLICGFMDPNEAFLFANNT